MILVLYPKIVSNLEKNCPVGNILSFPFFAGRGDVDDGRMMRGRWLGVTS
jgi:hypothetical protein